MSRQLTAALPCNPGPGPGAHPLPPAVLLPDLIPRPPASPPHPPSRAVPRGTNWSNYPRGPCFGGPHGARPASYPAAAPRPRTLLQSSVSCQHRGQACLHEDHQPALSSAPDGARGADGQAGAPHAARPEPGPAAAGSSQCCWVHRGWLHGPRPTLSPGLCGAVGCIVRTPDVRKAWAAVAQSRRPQLPGTTFTDVPFLQEPLQEAAAGGSPRSPRGHRGPAARQPLPSAHPSPPGPATAPRSSTRAGRGRQQGPARPHLRRVVAEPEEPAVFVAVAVAAATRRRQRARHARHDLSGTAHVLPALRTTSR